MKELWNRRELLSLLGGLSAASLLPKPLAMAANLITHTQNSEFKTKGFAIADGRKEKGIGHGYAATREDQPGSIRLGNFAGTHFKSFPTSFTPHQVVQNPGNIQHFFAIQKWGTNAVHLDVASGKTTALPIPKGVNVFGHGAFSADLDKLYISAMDYNKGRGTILVYDAKKITLLGTQISNGLYPHDLQLAKDRKTHWISNVGRFSKSDSRKYDSTISQKSNLSRIDLESGQVLETHEASDFNGMSHFLNLDDHKFLSIGMQGKVDHGESPTTFAIFDNAQVKNLAKSDALLKNAYGESLSVRLIQGTREALVTIPDCHKVVIVDIDKGQVLKVIDGVYFKAAIQLPDPNWLLLSPASGDTAPFMLYSVKDKNINQLPVFYKSLAPEMHNWFGFGSHGTEIIWPFT
ncbi:MAG TPA: DUF1513 domain-containing protein [Bdellovibrio sp.]|uniref:DUF1513 domain-containing protein n=1 Tax=Bdellovibrio sp. TaxID=28201 RepID=UPI002EE3A215